LDPILTLAKDTGSEIIAITADAGYSSTSVINEIEAANVIPFVDINKRGSKLLKKLKTAVNNLRDLSKQAIKNGLSKFQRKAWIADVKYYFAQSSQPISYDVKVKETKRSLTNWAHYARFHGLTRAEQKKEWRLRKKIQNIRRVIRNSGTLADKAIGNSKIMQGTIEWYLVYHIRGQNEGINGIIKKRGDLIGDGQHTTWKIGTKPLRNRVQSDLVMIKTSSLVYKLITGQTTHSMRFVHNWRVYRSNRSFLLIIWWKIMSPDPPNSVKRWEKNSLNRFFIN